MSWDSIEKIWNEQKSQTKDQKEIEMLLNHTKKANAGFRRKIFRRDALEVGVALFMAGYFFIMGLNQADSSRVGAWIMTFCCLLVLIFLIGTRIFAKKKRAEYPATIKGELEADLWDLRFQEKLLRSVVWWYLMPLAFGLIAMMISSVMTAPQPSAFVILILGVVLIAFVYTWIYRLNQKAVAKEILPRQESVLKLLSQWKS